MSAADFDEAMARVRETLDADTGPLIEGLKRLGGSEGWITAARATLEGEEVPPGESFGRAMREWEDDVLIIAYRALDALDAVLALHANDPTSYVPWCSACDYSYPCPTVRAIEGEA